jgi:regulatory protein
MRRRASPSERRERNAEVDDRQVVFNAALRFLESRQRSTAEVRRRLVSAGYRTELVDDAIARLTQLGVLDDTAFARAWVESRDRARPRGARALRRELVLKGVDRALIDETLASREPEEAGDPDVPAAERLIERHARQLARVADPRARRQRAYALLLRGGFDHDIAAALASRVAAPEAPAEEPSG